MFILYTFFREVCLAVAIVILCNQAGYDIFLQGSLDRGIADSQAVGPGFELAVLEPVIHLFQYRQELIVIGELMPLCSLVEHGGGVHGMTHTGEDYIHGGIEIFVSTGVFRNLPSGFQYPEAAEHHSNRGRRTP